MKGGVAMKMERTQQTPGMLEDLETKKNQSWLPASYSLIWYLEEGPRFTTVDWEIRFLIIVL